MTDCSRALESFRTGGIPTSWDFSTDMVELCKMLFLLHRLEEGGNECKITARDKRSCGYEHVIVRIVVIAINYL